MIKIDFTKEEIETLDYERYNYPHPKVQRKLEALWLKSQGVPHHEIARLTNISPNTLRAYLRQYQTGGIDALKQFNYVPKQSELMAHRTTIEDYFVANPPASLNEAIEKIYELTGIRRSRTRVREFIKKIGIKYQKVGHIPAEADLEAQEDFKKKNWNRVWTKRLPVREASFLLMPPILC